MTPHAKLGIGTVQFGLDYGLANAAGRTPETEARRIVERAAATGCRTIDTAAAYGDSELVIGRILPENSPLRIVTKTPPLGGQAIDEALDARICSGFTESLQRLRRESVFGLLVHHPADLLSPGGERLFESLKKLRESGLVERIGVSVYDRAQIDAVFARFDLDIVQLPLSVFDQRLLSDGTLDRLHDRGVEVHVRSVFLQGLLLMPREHVPAYFAPLLPSLAAWHERVAASGRSTAGAAFSFASNLEQVDCVIVGFDTLAQFDALLQEPDQPLPFPVGDLVCNDAAFVNPGLWRLA